MLPVGGIMKSKKLLTLVISLAFLGTGCSKIFMGMKERPKPTPTDRAPINAKGDLLGQEGDVANWFTKSPELEKVEGTQADRAYAELNVRTDVAPIVVAVIDSGVDVSHEDLQGQIWVNPGESGLDAQGRDKATNGIDDDGNGFVDDVNGWNFLGSYDKDHNPIDINSTTLEVTRELVRMKKLKAETEAQGQTLSETDAAYLAKLDKEVADNLKKSQDGKVLFESGYEVIKASYNILKPLLNVELQDLTLKQVEDLSVTEDSQVSARKFIIEAMAKLGSKDVARVLRKIKSFNSAVNYYYNENIDPRKDIIGDDVNDMADHNYGNNDLLGGDANHGTHVAGIIGAVRNNNLGVDGIATNVKIMVIRAVPDGDEYDKDVANAIRYAADNGARIASMSFGKAYSPNKKGVDEAYRYAASKGMLIVHAAGNDSLDTDVNSFFPNRYIQAHPGSEISTWVEVGASSANKGLTLPAIFSNYGRSSVDLFSPGVDLKSTVVGQKYATYSGTSMATPCVSGVAALVLSQHPNLTALELKSILKNSARTHPDLIVNLPGYVQEPLKVLFRKLSQTGGIVDAFEALKLAAAQH
jgi:cell wall-associated protease